MTIHREHGLRFVIYADDHEPAHVHVVGDHEAKINLANGEGSPELVWNNGLNKATIRRALRTVNEQQAMMLARWRMIHG